MMVPTCKARAVDVLDPMVWDEELLLPTHEHCTTAEGILHCQVRLLELILHMSEGGESGPVHHVFLLVRSPVACQKAIPASNDFSVKVRCELRPVIRQAADSKVAAQVR